MPGMVWSVITSVEARRIARETIERDDGVGRDDHLERPRFQQVAHERGHALLVLHDQHAAREPSCGARGSAARGTGTRSACRSSAGQQHGEACPARGHRCPRGRGRRGRGRCRARWRAPCPCRARPPWSRRRARTCARARPGRCPARRRARRARRSVRPRPLGSSRIRRRSSRPPRGRRHAIRPAPSIASRALIARFISTCSSWTGIRPGPRARAASSLGLDRHARRERRAQQLHRVGDERARATSRAVPRAARARRSASAG